jgi:diaminopimelate epimerase|tara:strand:- start:712 stop:1542 length:831 start_codon:yes stop_codon:yes gene_type:complete
MRLRFSKMHGLGNDFVVIDGINQRVRLSPEKVRRIADRHIGIGCDQLLLVEKPSSSAVDFRYRIFNCDGSEVENCGNGARCFAIFVRENKLTGRSRIKVETAAGILELIIKDDGQVTVDMGAPQLDPASLPFIAPKQANNYELELDGQMVEVGAVSMGNPHAVALVDCVTSAPVAMMGPLIESHPRFPKRVNAGFMQVLNRGEVNLRVFERGVGETQACGTGACGAVVSGRVQGLLDSTVKVNLPGGSLSISWQGPGEPVLMTGPATTVFHGQIKI